MLRYLLSLPLLMVVPVLPAVSQTTKAEKEKKPSGLVKGQDLPGPFQPYNVTGARAGRFHGLVTQTSLDPLVILIVRDLDYTPSLKALEEALDQRIDHNPNVRLGSFTVFLSDELPNVVEDDDKRDKMAEELRAKAKDLKHVVFCLDSKPDLANYNLDENAWATVVLVKKYQVVALHQLTKEKLNAEAVDEILREVAEQLGATKK